MSHPEETVAILTGRRFSAQSPELHHCEQRYQELVDLAKVILWRGGLDGSSFNYVNQEAEVLLGYPIEKWTGTSAFWIDHLHPEDRQLAESCCRAAAENRGPQRFEHRMIAANGKVVWLRIFGASGCMPWEGRRACGSDDGYHRPETGRGSSRGG